MNLKAAGKQLLRANIGKAFEELLQPGQYRGSNPLPITRGAFTPEVVGFGDSGVGAFFSWSGVSSSLKAYDRCPPLQAVCNRRALAFINGKLSVINSLGKPSSSAQSKRVLKLLRNPNPLQTQAAFLAQVHIYLDLVGYAVIVPMRPVGYEITDAEQLWVIPPTLCELVSYSNQLNFLNGGIDYVMIGNRRVDPKEVMIITDINPAIDSMVKPGHRIKSLELPINNIIGAYESESTLIKHRGPTGIISAENDREVGGVIPMEEEDKIAIQKSFNQSYGLLAGQSHIVVAAASAIKYQKTGFSAEELGLHKSIENGTKAICDTVGYPTELMGIVNPTYNNKESAGKEVYTKYIMPSSVNIAEQIGSYLLPDTDTLIIDYSHVPELQQDKNKEATARKTLGEALEREFRLNMITYNRMLVLLGEEPREGFDKYYYELKDSIDFVFDKGGNNPQQNANNEQGNTQQPAS